MALVEKSVIIERTPAQMFALVDRVEDYPDFLPWCAATELLQRDELITSARIRVAYRGISTQFSTVNRKEPPSLMLIHLREGPFTRLEGRWRFVALGDSGCKIEFRLDYEFSNRILAKALGPVFDFIADSLVESFVVRARQSRGD